MEGGPLSHEKCRLGLLPLWRRMGPSELPSIVPSASSSRKGKITHPQPCALGSYLFVPMCTQVWLTSGRDSAAIPGPLESTHHPLPHCPYPVSPVFSFELPQRRDGAHQEGLLGVCESSVVSPTTGLHPGWRKRWGTPLLSL